MSKFSLPMRRGGAVARGTVLAVMLAAALPIGSGTADARAGGGLSFGSRGTRTYSMPSPTATAPRPAQPMQRSETPSSTFRDPGLGTTGFGAQPRRFGFGTGLAAGLLGAGLFGMLTGGGFFGGLGSIASLFGLLLQVGLIGGAIWLALRLFRGRAGPAYAGLGAARSAGAGFGGPSGGRMGPSPAQAPSIRPRDFSAFEQALCDIQLAFGREDFGALSRLTTAEMLRHFGSQIEQNRAQGLRNPVADPKLLQGDLAEAWREGGADYATVAMRFSVRDTMVERASGRIVSGDPDRPSEATELWTFRRDNGGPWLLSAIQQAG